MKKKNKRFGRVPRPLALEAVEVSPASLQSGGIVGTIPHLFKKKKKCWVLKKRELFF
jgi:hypothetical protein